MPDSMVAAFGDVHSNLEALQAVLADMERLGIRRRICLGDTVGYAANPAQCLEVVMSLGCPVLKGNHDDFAADDGVATRGFKGYRAYDTFFTWPLWTRPLSCDAVASLLALELLQTDEPTYSEFQHCNVSYAFRSQRILVGKTLNLTTARAIG